MKSRPILFSPLMVKAILEGRKTQTRRVIKNLLEVDYPGEKKLSFVDAAVCLYGSPGDELWVREACQILGYWRENGTTKSGKQAWKFIEHRSQLCLYDGHFVESPKNREELGYYMRPSIHCPRWTSRFVLKITYIRAERLLSISEQDAIAEGVTKKAYYATDGKDDFFVESEYGGNYQEGYFALWNSINGYDAHKVNPWVWVVEFEKHYIETEHSCQGLPQISGECQ